MSPEALSDFTERSKTAVRSYIRSVLLVDDDGPDRNASRPAPDDDPKFDEALVDDGDGSDTIDLANDGDVPQPPVVTRATNELDRETLLRIEDAVLREGVLFSAVRYCGQADRSRVTKLARHADILILDWHLVHRDNGAEAVTLLQALGSTELRFICVFTGDGQVGDVRAEIIEKLGV